MARGERPARGHEYTETSAPASPAKYGEETFCSSTVERPRAEAATEIDRPAIFRTQRPREGTHSRTHAHCRVGLRHKRAHDTASSFTTLPLPDKKSVEHARPRTRAARAKSHLSLAKKELSSIAFRAPENFSLEARTNSFSFSSSFAPSFPPPSPSPPPPPPAPLAAPSFSSRLGGQQPADRSIAR